MGTLLIKHTSSTLTGKVLDPSQEVVCINDPRGSGRQRVQQPSTLLENIRDLVSRSYGLCGRLQEQQLGHLEHKVRVQHLEELGPKGNCLMPQRRAG